MPFQIDQLEHIVRLTLNRPEKHNAMNRPFFKALRSHFRQFDQDPEVRAVVIRAAGKSFSAGTDVEDAAAMLTGPGAEQRERLRNRILKLQESISAIEDCRKPVIAAIHGHCLGGGLDLICACDIRIADASAVFSIRETRMGIVADLGVLQRLPMIIGDGRFRELAYTGRDFDAAEALQIGLISKICSDREALYAHADAIAGQIAANPPLTVQGTKEVLRFSRDHGVQAGLAYAARVNTVVLLSDDLREAFTAFRDKRRPLFKGK
jgi:enoyl-CoA hydratase